MPDEGGAAFAPVIRFYDRYAAGEGLQAADEAFAEAIDFEVRVPAYLFEFAGHRHGKAQALEALRAIAEKYEISDFERRLTIVDGDAACVYSEATIRSRGGGPKARVELCDVMRLRDGKIVWFREFFDAASAAAAIFGGPVHVG